MNIATESATGTLSKCTDTSNTGGSASFTGSENSGTASADWKSGGTTTSSFSFTEGGSACPSGETEIVASGKVKKSTGKAASIKKGQPLSATICWNTTTNKITLAKGTKFEI